MSCYAACTISVFLLTFVLSPSRFILSDEIPKCQDGNNTAKSCCPCFRESVDSCDMACPSDYLTINASKQLIKCEKNSSSVTVETTTTTVPVTTTTETNVTENVTILPYPDDIFIVQYCTKSCDKGKWYNNATLKCDKCDKRCLMCYTNENCSVCRYELNNTCYAKCPEGSEDSGKQSESGAELCEYSKSEPEKKLPIGIIAGSAAGVVVLAVVITVIICFVCRRHRDNADIIESKADGQKTAMSVLLENKPENGNDGVAGKKQASRPAGYENMSHTLPTDTQIQNQGDKILRYTKDPTVNINNRENVDNVEEEENYGNSAMIKLAQKTDLTHKAKEDMEEMLDIETMGVAPKAPISLPSSKGKLNRKEKKSVPEPKEHIPEDYVDMSGAEKKEETGNASDLEDYVNVNYEKIPVGRKAFVGRVPETSQEDQMEIYENTAPSSDKTSGDNMEDYENTQELKLSYSKKPKGKGEAQPESAEKDLEDYENMKDLELYENIPIGKQK